MSIQEKLNTIAENIPRVYEAGIAEGKTQGELEFWNTFTNNGARTNYNYAFREWSWTVANSPVKIRPTGQYLSFFYQSPNLEEIIPDNFDFSATPDVQAANTNAYYHTFSQCPKLKVVPDMNMPPRGMYYTFYLCYKLERIEKIRVREDTQFDGPFQGCNSLTYVRFDGTIGNTISFKWCPLGKDSIENIISCLSSNVSGKTLTLNVDAVNKAFETSEGAKNGSTSAEWNALTSAHQNWTISLVTG